MRRFAVVSVLATMVAGVGLVACGDDEANDSGQMNGGDGDATGDGDDGDAVGDGDQGGDGDDSGGDGDTSGGDGDDQPAANAGTCETSTQPNMNAVDETQKNETYPTPMGGTIQDGVYFLTSFNVYSPAQADDHSRAWLIEIAGNKIATVNVSDNDPRRLPAGTFTTSGSTLTLQLTCPGAMSKSLPYTATANEIRLFDTDEPNMQVYTKQ